MMSISTPTTSKDIDKIKKIFPAGLEVEPQSCYLEVLCSIPAVAEMLQLGEMPKTAPKLLCIILQMAWAA